MINGHDGRPLERLIDISAFITVGRPSQTCRRQCDVAPTSYRAPRRHRPTGGPGDRGAASPAGRRTPVVCDRSLVMLVGRCGRVLLSMQLPSAPL